MRIARISATNLTIIGAVCALVIALTVSYRERIAFYIEPTAARAYTSGMHHLNSLDAAAYDIAEAEYFFMKAAEIDPQYPYVQHQIARIHFLQGRYPEALDAINTEVANDPTERAPVFYMRGLIEGYLGEYDAAVQDYERVVRLTPDRWEGRVDYAWVLIKTNDFTTALHVVDEGLNALPDNAWLLSMRAVILHEQGNNADALIAARTAKEAVGRIDERTWLIAYPGNAPEAARVGIQTLRESAQKNLDLIEAAAEAH